MFESNASWRVAPSCKAVGTPSNFPKGKAVKPMGNCPTHHNGWMDGWMKGKYTFRTY